MTVLKARKLSERSIFLDVFASAGKQCAFCTAYIATDQLYIYSNANRQSYCSIECARDDNTPIDQ